MFSDQQPLHDISVPVVAARTATMPPRTQSLEHAQQAESDVPAFHRVLPLIESLGWHHRATEALLTIWRKLLDCKTEFQRLSRVLPMTQAARAQPIWIDAYWNDE